MAKPRRDLPSWLAAGLQRSITLVMGDFTKLLESMRGSGSDAGERVLSLVYSELRQLARVKMARELPGQTLQPTALVHEAWLRLGEPADFANRAHFFGAAAEAMRRILIDRARRRLAVRHGGGLARVELDDLQIAAPAADEELLVVHEALEALEKESQQQAELVKLRYFAGLSFEEAAEALSISVRTAKRHWTYARAWLYAAIKDRQ